MLARSHSLPLAFSLFRRIQREREIERERRTERGRESLGEEGARAGAKPLEGLGVRVRSCRGTSLIRNSPRYGGLGPPYRISSQ